MPDTSTVALIFAGLFLLAMAYLGYRVLATAKEVRIRGERVERELKAAVASRGWTYRKIRDRNSRVEWRIEGTTRGGEAFSLESHATRALNDQSSRADTASMVWTCPGLRRHAAVFLLGSTRNIVGARGPLAASIIQGMVRLSGKVSEVLGKVSKDPGGTAEGARKAEDSAHLVTDGPIVEIAGLGERWRVVARDESLARRVFDEALCAMLVSLPRVKLINADTDNATWLEYGAEGASFTLGFLEFVDSPTPHGLSQSDLAGIVLAVGEKVEEGLAAEKTILLDL